MKKYIIATRGSQLALAQANWVAGQLRANGMDAELNIIKTKGDVVQDRFDKMEGKGFFTKEIEDALVHGEAQIAVHSLKDLPTESPEGLVVKAVPQREKPWDLLISKKPLPVDEQGRLGNLSGWTVGTSSNRRVYALNHLGANFEPIRGNVPTRLRKMEEGLADAVVLAQAGLNRLNIDLSGFQVYAPPPELMVPAPGQGALGIQTRDDFDGDLSFLHHTPTADAVHAERYILNRLEGGCQLPLGVLILPQGGGYQLHLFLGSVENKFEPLRLSLEGPDPARCAAMALAQLQERKLIQ